MPLRLEDFINERDQINQKQIAKEVTGGLQGFGFCMAFSLLWAINCQKEDAGSPVEEFRTMMSSGEVYFRQVIQNFRAYVDHWRGSTATSELSAQHEITRNVVSLMSRKTLCVGPLMRDAGSADDLSNKIRDSTGVGNSRPRTCAILLGDVRGGDTGHMAAATLAKIDGVYKWCLLDPNDGLMQFAPEKLDTVIQIIWGIYKPKYAACVDIVSMKKAQ
jgi:hypothetical protein